MDWSKLTYEEDRQKNLTTYQQLIEGEIETFEFEKRYWHKEGHLVWCRLQVTIVEDQKTAKKLTLALIEDISVKKQLEKEVERQKVMLQMGEQAAGIGTFIWNTETNETEASSEVYRIYELDEESTNPQNLFERAMSLTHPDDVELLRKDIMESAREKKLIHTNYRIQFPDGRIKWLKTTPGAILDKVWMLRTVQDISEEMKKSALLLHQKEMIQMGEGVSRLGTIIWDIHNWDLEISDGIYQIFGIETPTEKVKESFDAFFRYVNPEDLPKVITRLKQISESKEGGPLEFRINTKDGKEKWIKSYKGKFLDERRRLTTLQDITEEVKKTNLLSRQKEIIEIGERISGLGTFVWDVESREVEASPGLYQLAGLEEGSLDPKALMAKLLSLIHPEDKEALANNMDLIAEKKTTSPIEFRVILETGQVKWLRTSDGKFLNEREKLGTMLDITEEKLRTEQLEQQGRIIRSGELTANVGTFLWDTESKEINASQGFYKCFGLEEEEIENENLFARTWSMIHPEDVDKMRARNEQILRGELPCTIDFRIIIPDGEIRWLRNYPGEFITAKLKLGTIQDISEEKARTELLERQEELIRLGEEVGNIGVDIWNLETGEFYYSPHLLQMFEIDPKEVTDTNLLELLSLRFHPEDKKVIDVFTQKIVKNPPEQVEMKHRILTKKGGVKWVQVISQPYTSPNMRITINKDITDFVHKSEKLLEAQKEMEQLLYTVSHDLRAPLRHVSSYAGMVKKATDGKLDTEESRYLSNVIKASARLGTMIDELLQFFRNRNIEMMRVPIDLEEITRRTIELFSSDTESRAIEWKIGPIPKVKGDPLMLEKVMLNLLSNAVKFTTKTDAACIEISAREMGEMLLIQVIDNGAGFKMKYIDKLFAVFQRLHNRSDFEGTGIGLSNVKRIIERHGGSIWAEGEVDKGAKFYFTLPLA